jgi:hypothetical protein
MPLFIATENPLYGLENPASFCQSDITIQLFLDAKNISFKHTEKSLEFFNGQIQLSYTLQCSNLKMQLKE